MPRRTFLILASAVTLSAVLSRVLWLTLKPFHHDEGVNGFFLLKLLKEGTFRYDPSNYHGPDLFYITFFITRFLGVDEFGTRFSVAIFGIAIVVMVFWLRRQIGDIGALVAGTLLAISPGMVYISRYFIHEMIFVFFSLAIPIGTLFFIERRKAGLVAQGFLAIILGIALLPTQIIIVQQLLGNESSFSIGVRGVTSALIAVLIYYIVKTLSKWRDGSPIFLVLAVVSTCMLFITKETAFVTVGTMILACVSVVVWELVTGRSKSDSEELTLRAFQSAFGSPSERTLLVGLCIGLFVFFWVLFFSSFFTNPVGIIDSFRAYAIWAQTGTDDHKADFWAYLRWLSEIEAPILILSFLGCAIALVKQKNRFVVFTAFWAMGLALAYSIIPYKTPWLMLSFLLPMTILAGHVSNEMFRNGLPVIRVLAVMFLLSGVGIAGWQSWSLNFVRFDDQSLPYVYAHTWRSYDDMVAKIHEIDEKVGGNKDIRITVVTTQYWPLPWSLRDYERIVFAGRPGPSEGAEVIIAEHLDNMEEILTNYQDGYRSLGNFALRPGVTLTLLVREGIADADAEKLRLELIKN